MPVKSVKRYLCVCFVAMVCVLTAQSVLGGPLLDLIKARRAPAGQGVDDEAGTSAAIPLPGESRLIPDVPYGTDPLQTFDVYVPEGAKSAPVIFMVHGGGWRHGDKSNDRVVANKVDRWLPQGFIFISVNYRLLPDADPLEQAKDVARALAVAQQQIGNWGGERSKFILMGHSAGAHLVAFLTASPEDAYGLGVVPWLGSVFLDSAALDVVEVMRSRHLPLYDRAFGGDPAYWAMVSPYHVMSEEGPPMLAVCSSQRKDNPCATAHRFSEKAKKLDRSASVLEEDFSHGEINALLGKDPVYTKAVEAFLRSLDEAVADVLVGAPDKD